MLGKHSLHMRTFEFSLSNPTAVLKFKELFKTFNARLLVTTTDVRWGVEGSCAELELRIRWSDKQPKKGGEKSWKRVGWTEPDWHTHLAGPLDHAARHRWRWQHWG